MKGSVFHCLALQPALAMQLSTIQSTMKKFVWGLCLPHMSGQCSLGTWNSSGTRSAESDLGSAELCVTRLTEKHCKSVPDYRDLVQGGCYVIEAFFK